MEFPGQVPRSPPVSLVYFGVFKVGLITNHHVCWETLPDKDFEKQGKGLLYCLPCLLTGAGSQPRTCDHLGTSGSLPFALILEDQGDDDDEGPFTVPLLLAGSYAHFLC